MTTPAGPVPSSDSSSPAGSRPRLIGRVGSLDAFWPLVEPILTALRPRRLCEIGVDQGIFTDRLLAWGKQNGCAYVGIDPAPDPAAAERIRLAEAENPGASELVTAPSLDALRELAPCEAYFIDGDHNYHTVRHELELIVHSAGGVGPVVFAHDVGWPWARRDMYHRPETIPPQERHPHSGDLGVSLDGDELVAGGLRLQGRYSIARHAGGPRNGVLTAIEDFLTGNTGTGWRLVVVPIAYGLAVLYRPDSVPERCRVLLEELRTAAGTTREFFESCEANFLHLYLYAEDARAQLAYLSGSEVSGRSSYEQLEEAYRALEGKYADLTAHSDTLLKEFNALLGAYKDLDHSFRHLREERDALQRRLGDSGEQSTPPGSG